MNAFDYFFSETAVSDKLFLLGTKESITFRQLYGQVTAVAASLQAEAGNR